MSAPTPANAFAALRTALAEMRVTLQGDAGQVLVELGHNVGSTAPLLDWAVDAVAEVLLALRQLVNMLGDVAREADPMLAVIETGAGALPEGAPSLSATVGGSLGDLLAAIMQGVQSLRQALDAGLEATRLWPSIADREAVSGHLVALIGTATALPVDGLLGGISRTETDLFTPE